MKRDQTHWQRPINTEAPHLSKHVVEIDIKRHPTHHDILNDESYSQLFEAAKEGRILVITGGPNCRTWSRLLNRPRTGKFHGPLRGRAPGELWGKEDMEHAQRAKCDMDSLLMIRMLNLIYEAGKHRILYLLEHPADAGPPHPSFWLTDQCRSLLRNIGGHLITFDACRMGQITAKATTVITNMERIYSIHNMLCNHKQGHERLEDNEGLARWPWELMILIAQAIAEGVSRDARLADNKSHKSLPNQPAGAAHAPTDRDTGRTEAAPTKDSKMAQEATTKDAEDIHDPITKTGQAEADHRTGPRRHGETTPSTSRWRPPRRPPPRLRTIGTALVALVAANGPTGDTMPTPQEGEAQHPYKDSHMPMTMAPNNHQADSHRTNSHAEGSGNTRADQMVNTNYEGSEPKKITHLDLPDDKHWQVWQHSRGGGQTEHSEQKNRNNGAILQSNRH